jgi:Poly(A) polymerase catalytic subunit
MKFRKPIQKYMKKTMKKKYESSECSDDMTFEECELAILRHSVDENDKIQRQKMVSGDEIKKMIDIVESFLVKKKLICYGGTAINNILPKYAQFYDRQVEIPDYDFYSPNALDDAKELADIYFAAGYADVEAKSGVHQGTYKVFVNYIPMADITYLHPELFASFSKDAVSIAGIKYSPPNILRMNMYLELSRPAGDISRWEKVLKRLTLLNTYYPMKIDYNCTNVDFQRKMDNNEEHSEQLYTTVRDTFIELGVVFFGGYASSLYSQYMPESQRHLVKKIPDFDVLYEDPEKCATIVQERLESLGYKKIRIIKHEAIGEIIPEHVEILYGKDILAFVYKPVACHNYNIFRQGHQVIQVATIDTILSFYLAFMYANAPYYYKDRILCMAQFLFEVKQKNRLSQKGLLKRFSMTCYGKQETLESIRAKKADKFKELRNKKNSKEYEEWFLRYNPGENKKIASPVAEESIVVKKDGSVKTSSSKNKTSKNHLYFPKFSGLFI